MHLEHEFTINMPIEDAWKVLTDIERLAPCMPGATLIEVVDGEHRGMLTVKLGPVTTKYRGVVRFLESDRSAGRVVIEARGNELRGRGTATAKITGLMTEQGEHTRVVVHSDIDVTGTAAQFGRGVMAEVSKKLIGQFVAELERTTAEGSSSTPSTPSSAISAETGAAGTPTAASAEPAQSQVALDGLGLVAVPILKRLLPVGVAVALTVVLMRWLRRR